MKIQYCSDLHLEFPENYKFIKKNPLKPVGDILVIAGDFYLLCYHTASINDFISYVSDNFKEIYWVPGNHEYYHSDISKWPQSFQENIKSNFFLINNKMVERDNVSLVFSTLWGNIPQSYQWYISQNVSDFHVIKNRKNTFTPEHFNSFHQESLSFIQKSIESVHDGKSVVVSHHVPTNLNYPEVYKGSNLNAAFSVELYDYIEQSNIDYWIFGHHHVNVPAFSIGKTNMLTNQLGYIHHSENDGFRYDACIEL